MSANYGRAGLGARRRQVPTQAGLEVNARNRGFEVRTYDYMPVSAIKQYDIVLGDEVIGTTYSALDVLLAFKLFDLGRIAEGSKTKLS